MLFLLVAEWGIILGGVAMFLVVLSDVVILTAIFLLYRKMTRHGEWQEQIPTTVDADIYATGSIAISIIFNINTSVILLHVPLTCVVILSSFTADY